MLSAVVIGGRRYSRGFTLLEVAVVLFIIGLLVDRTKTPALRRSALVALAEGATSAVIPNLRSGLHDLSTEATACCE